MTKRLFASPEDLPETAVERTRELADAHDVEPVIVGDYADNARPEVLKGLEPTRKRPHGCFVPEPMFVRKARENAEAIRNMGREEIAKAHRLGVDAHYTYTDRDIGPVIVREVPDGIRHLEEKVDGAWVEVGTLPPRPDWIDPQSYS